MIPLQRREQPSRAMSRHWEGGDRDMEGGHRDTDRELPGPYTGFPGLHFKLSPRQPEHLRGA